MAGQVPVRLLQVIALLTSHLLVQPRKGAGHILRLLIEFAPTPLPETGTV